MADPSEVEDLMLISGDGECEMSVCDTDKEPTGDVCLARFRARPQPLSMETLQGARDGLEQCGELGEELGSCLDLALERFCREPQYVQENARLLIRWDGGELEFVSGEGQCDISVCYMDSEPHYHITAQTGDVYLTWLLSHPEPLSSANLASVRDSLESCGVMGEELRNCFNLALQEFHREPPCVQANAKMLIQCKRGSLAFLSGEGQCEISVRCRDGKPHYDVGELPMHMYLDRLHAQPEPLSADTLWKVWRKLVSCRRETATLRACISHALDQFIQEPRCVQENARLLIRWGGGELEFISGQGQCEISVLLADGRPQYHITELGGDRPVTWSHASPEPLSVTDLARVRDRLGHWGALGEELSGCFEEAISQFSQEPPCVQENARLGICWDGGSLKFLSGDGQCEISVLCFKRLPLYLDRELPVHMYLARLRARQEPLSADTLWRVWSKLGSCKGDRDDLKACFYCAWEGFSREPQDVQGNARLLIQWSGEELEFTSGKGECEITVHYGDGRPQYHAVKIPVHMYLERLHARSDSLSTNTLRRVLSELGSCHGDTNALRACFLCAWQGFSREPRCVQENARLLIQCDGQELEFVSGRGQCEISVLLADGEPQYHITELGGDRPVTWSHASPEPLSVADLARVRDRLGHWGALGEELSGCFGEAISQFSREPPCVQGNARMKLCSEMGRLKFLSGEGECEISVHYRDGRSQYKVGELPVHMYLDRLRTHPEPLSANTLWRVLRKLLSCQGYTSTLRACVCQALDQFVQEPRCVQENTRLLIRCDGQELEFVSGRGQCEFLVLLADGEPQYRITELGGDRPVTWSHSSPEPLSVADLARVRDRLGHWGALGEELSGCFGEAISQFSREPPCVQGNARLRLCWYGGSLEFLSGEGLCEISVCYRDGRPQYDVGQLPIHMYLNRLRANPPPLSSDILLRVCNELQFCEGDTEALRACLERARDGFCSEPISIQNNSKLTVQCNQVTLEFTSGEGENEIKVCRGREGEIQYTVKELEWWERIARLFQ
ncbi:uncharacterized protein LOC128847215 [Malaclemys terrapin pileata]|uniref:uncharacterized protein LOC128847215 n=1 Tax=Malaclemys terrapin pileata TaxID=2991368 RepID=UPI0023A8AE43|nr:uncharacterized protein LOC128847215 [Malaclemys terrapin pileata]